MEKPVLELVLQVLDALYRNEGASEKEKASAWLMKLQASVHAWEIADRLLLLKRDTETSYFAAQTMQTKIRLSFDELPSETHHVRAIRDSLFHFLCSSDSMSALDMANPIADELILLEGSGLEVYDALHNKMVVPAALPPPPAATLPPPPAALPPPAAAPRGPALIQPECGGLV
eukprot:Em0001g3567a